MHAKYFTGMIRLDNFLSQLPQEIGQRDFNRTCTMTAAAKTCPSPDSGAFPSPPISILDADNECHCASAGLSVKEFSKTLPIGLFDFFTLWYNYYIASHQPQYEN